MLRSIIVAVCAVLGAVAVVPTAAAEDDPVLVGNATGGGWVAGTEGGHPPTAAEARVLAAKVAIWEAYDALTSGTISRSEFDATLARNAPAANLAPEAAEAAEAAQTVQLRPPPCGDINDPCPDAVLDVSHVGQSTNYYCGPASGVMIARYKGKGRSAHTGASLTQAKMANVAHMHTEETGSTPYHSGKFTRGLNKWLYGEHSDAWRFTQINSPSIARYKQALRFNINTWMPIGVSTVELESEDRNYNGHVYSVDGSIGHWIVARGYEDFGARVKYLDPATTVWQETDPRFSMGSHRMVGSYVDYNGISAT